MRTLSHLKTHSPLLRVIVWAGVIVYGFQSTSSMVEQWAIIQTERMEQAAGPLGGCETDMECESAERAAKLAVYGERRRGRR